MNISEITHELSARLWPHGRNDSVSRWFDQQTELEIPNGFRFLQSEEDYRKNPNHSKLGKDDRKYVHQSGKKWITASADDSAWNGNYPGSVSRAICLVLITQHDIDQLDTEKKELLQQDLPVFLSEESKPSGKKGRKIAMRLLDPSKQYQEVILPLGSEVFAARPHMGITPAIFYLEGGKKGNERNEIKKIYLYRVGEEYPEGKLSKMLGAFDLFGEMICVFTDR